MWHIDLLANVNYCMQTFWSASESSIISQRNRPHFKSAGLWFTKSTDKTQEWQGLTLKKSANVIPAGTRGTPRRHIWVLTWRRCLSANEDRLFAVLPLSVMLGIFKGKPSIRADRHRRSLPYLSTHRRCILADFTYSSAISYQRLCMQPWPSANNVWLRAIVEDKPMKIFAYVEK